MGVQFDPGEQRGFLAVGSDQIQAGKNERALGFGIEGDEFPRGPAQCGGACHHGIVQQAFGVIRQDHGVRRPNGGAEQGIELGRLDVIGRRRRLAIQPAKLLVLDQHPGLHDRRPASWRREDRNAFVGQNRFQLGTGVVAAHETGHRALGSERGDIEGNVPGSARGVGIVIDVDDRHRSLGRDPGGVTPHVMVKHHVSDDEDAQAGDFFKQNADFGGSDGHD